MKRFHALLALLLALLLPASALAATLTETITLPDGNYQMLYGGVLVRDEGSEYWLVDPTGAAISPRYIDVDNASGSHLSTFTVSAEMNTTGLLDNSTGEVIIPASYGAVEILSEDWIAGVVLTPSDASDAPYWGLFGGKFDYVQTDLYYRGELLATIPAEECGSMAAYGDFVRFTTDTNVWWMSAAGEKVVYERNLDYTSEYNQDFWEDTITHNGTGQLAFTASCTLTADQVLQPLTLSGKDVIDLQGNVVIPADAFPSGASVSAMAGGWIKLGSYNSDTSVSSYGVMDSTGKVVVPVTECQFPNLNENSIWFSTGYLPCLTADGQLIIYNTAGEITASATLPAGTTINQIQGFYDCSPLLVIKGDAPIVISATAGQLDVSAYEDVHFSSYNGYQLLPVKQNGLWGCIDMNGELVVPCMYKYQPSVSSDGTRVLGVTYNAATGYSDVLCIIAP